MKNFHQKLKTLCRQWLKAMDFFSEVIKQLSVLNVESPRLEAREIFAYVLQKDVSEIYSGCVVNNSEKQKIEEIVQKRKNYWPLDKIIGKKGFYKYDFVTNEYVLSPRPDTEILVEKALALLPKDSQTNMLDLGTGSGCIVESILGERPKMHGWAVDVSPQALDVAKKNAINLQVLNRLNFIQASWFDQNFLKNFAEPFQLIVSNPPYIPQKEISSLQEEVKKYDPLLALDGGESGYESYMKIAEWMPLLLDDNAYVLLEAGIGQAATIAKIFEQKNLNLIEIVPDLAGIDRCVILQK